MKILKLLALLAVIALVPAACNDDDDDDGNGAEPAGTITFKVNLLHDSTEVELFDTVSLSASTDFYLSLFRMYLSRIHATDAAGNTIEVKDVEIFSPGTDSASVFTAQVPARNYQSISVGFGLDAQLNDSDPNSFPASHPLSPEEVMYWPMMKYRFVKFEGRVFEGGNSIPIAYHTGFDVMYHTQVYNQDFAIAENQNTEMVLTLHLDQIFDGPAGRINYMVQPTWHGDTTTMAMAQLFSANMAQSATLHIQ